MLNIKLQFFIHMLIMTFLLDFVLLEKGSTRTVSILTPYCACLEQSELMH